MFGIEVGEYSREVDEGIDAAIREAHEAAHQETIREAAGKPDPEIEVADRRGRLMKAMKRMYPRETVSYHRQIVEMTMAGEGSEPALSETEIKEMFETAVSA